MDYGLLWLSYYRVFEGVMVQLRENVVFIDLDIEELLVSRGCWFSYVV